MDPNYVIILDQQTLIQVGIQLVNTLILCFALYKILYKPVLAFLNQRKQTIADNISNAETKLSQAEELKSQYEQKLSEIEQERAEILEKARLEAKAQGEKIIDEANEEASTLKKRAETDIKRDKEKAKDEIKNQIIEVSSLLSGKFIAAKITKEEQDKLVDSAIDALEDAQWIG